MWVSGAVVVLGGGAVLGGRVRSAVRCVSVRSVLRRVGGRARVRVLGAGGRVRRSCSACGSAVVLGCGARGSGSGAVLGVGCGGRLGGRARRCGARRSCSVRCAVVLRLRCGARRSCSGAVLGGAVLGGRVGGRLGGGARVRCSAVRVRRSVLGGRVRQVRCSAVRVGGVLGCGARRAVLAVGSGAVLGGRVSRRSLLGARRSCSGAVLGGTVVLGAVLGGRVSAVRCSAVGCRSVRVGARRCGARRCGARRCGARRSARSRARRSCSGAVLGGAVLGGRCSAVGSRSCSVCGARRCGARTVRCSAVVLGRSLLVGVRCGAQQSGAAKDSKSISGKNSTTQNIKPSPPPNFCPPTPDTHAATHLCTPSTRTHAFFFQNHPHGTDHGSFDLADLEAKVERAKQAGTTSSLADALLELSTSTSAHMQRLHLRTERDKAYQTIRNDDDTSARLRKERLCELYASIDLTATDKQKLATHCLQIVEIFEHLVKTTAPGALAGEQVGGMLEGLDQWMQSLRTKLEVRSVVGKGAKVRGIDSLSQEPALDMARSQAPTHRARDLRAQGARKMEKFYGQDHGRDRRLPGKSGQDGRKDCARV